MLPPELWLMIFHYVLQSDDGFDPSKLCSHITFPELHFQLRFPMKYAGRDTERENLRLVCRRFNGLLQLSSTRFLMRHPDLDIPVTAKLLYISSFQDTRICVERLLATPLERFRALVSLFIPIEPPGWGVEHEAFDLLCAHAPTGLSCVRSLTVTTDGLECDGAFVPRFWTRINCAFPELFALAALGNILTMDDDEEVTFYRVEVLDVHSTRLDTRLFFPKLRHVAFYLFTQYERAAVSRSPLVESMLIHYLELSQSVAWRSFKQLRLLGMPLVGLNVVASHPHEYPLEHIRIQMDKPMPKKEGEDIVAVVKRMVKQFPAVTYAILEFSTVTEQQGRLNRLACEDRRLRSMGLTCREAVDGKERLVIERVEYVAQGIPGVTLLSKARTVLARLSII